MKIQINPQEISRNINDENRYQPPEQTAPRSERDRFEELLNKGNENETNENPEEGSEIAQKSGMQEVVPQKGVQANATKTQEKTTDHSEQEDLLEKRQHPSKALGGAHKKAEKKQGRLDGDPRLNPGLLAAGAPSLAKLPGGNPVTETHPVTSPAKLHELTEKIVSRILVSAPDDAAKTPEVRITLDNGIMKGTEVRITRDGNELNVSFFTETADAGNLLSQQQGIMKQTLSQNLRLDVHVSVGDAKSQQQQDNNQGRSRQRRYIQDEYQSD